MVKATLLLIAALAFAISPYLGGAFEGYRLDQLPVQIARHPIQPVGWAFAIWGVIYVWLMVHAVFGLVKRAEDPAWDATRLPMIVVAVIGAAWTSIALYSPVWGTITIWPMAIGALMAFLIANPNVDRWLLSAPIAMLAGWLTAAASVSTGIVIGGYGLMSPLWAAVAMLVLVLAIAIPVQMRRPAMPVYGLTVIWALAGVIAANWAEVPTVAILAALGAVLMSATLFFARRA